MTTPLPACPGCGVVPTWSHPKSNVWRFSCRCNGLDFEALKHAPKAAVDEMKAQMEQAWRDEHTERPFVGVLGLTGSVQ